MRAILEPGASIMIAARRTAQDESVDLPALQRTRVG